MTPVSPPHPQNESTPDVGDAVAYCNIGQAKASCEDYISRLTTLSEMVTSVEALAILERFASKCL